MVKNQTFALMLSLDYKSYSFSAAILYMTDDRFDNFPLMEDSGNEYRQVLLRGQMMKQ